jgi:hypothetical protein
MLLITQLDDNEDKPPIIVAYLRKPHICNNTLDFTVIVYGQYCSRYTFR